MTVTAVRLGGRPDLPLLVLGPSLGTSATTLWSAAAQHLARDFQVVAWDLPGHGTNRFPLPDEEPLTIAGLAADVLELVDSLVDGFGPARFHYAGDSVGGAVGLQLLLDAPQRVASATLLCTGARIGSAESWQERIDTGPGLGHAGAGQRLRGPLVRPRLPRPRARARLGPAARAPGRRRRRLRRGLRGARRRSTYATGCGRSRCPCSRWPGPPTWPRRRAAWRWSPRASTDGRLVGPRRRRAPRARRGAGGRRPADPRARRRRAGA